MVWIYTGNKMTRNRNWQKGYNLMIDIIDVEVFKKFLNRGIRK